MEATTSTRRWRAALFFAPPLACWLLIGGVWLVGAVVARAHAGPLDIELGVPPVGPRLVVKVDQNGPPRAPRRVVVGLNFGQTSPPRGGIGGSSTGAVPSPSGATVDEPTVPPS